MFPRCLEHCNAEGTYSEYPGILRAGYVGVKVGIEKVVDGISLDKYLGKNFFHI